MNLYRANSINKRRLSSEQEMREARRTRRRYLLAYQLIRGVRDEVRQRTTEDDPRLQALTKAAHVCFTQLLVIDAALAHANKRGLPHALEYSERSSVCVRDEISRSLALDKLAGFIEDKKGARA